MGSIGVLACLAALACALCAEARAFSEQGRQLQQAAAPMSAGPPVTAEAVKPGSPYVIDPWTVGMTYPDVNITSGQSVQLIWPGRHGVYMLVNSTCPDSFATNGPNVLSQIKPNSQYTTPPLKAGSYYFACQVPGHCENGQIVHVTAA